MIARSETVSKLYASLAKAQGGMGLALKDGVNPAFRSAYTTLPAVLEAVLPSFNANGLAVLQHPAVADDASHVIVHTLITHESGEWMESAASLPVGGKRDAHAVGSAISYLRRYTLASIAGVIQADDDGNGASGAPSGPTPTPVQPQRPAPAPAPTRPAQPAPATQATPAPAAQPKATAVASPPAGAPAERMSVAELKSEVSKHVSYDVLVDWCVARGKPTPAELEPHVQRQMIGWLESAGKDALRTWDAQRQAAKAEADRLEAEAAAAAKVLAAPKAAELAKHGEPSVEEYHQAVVDAAALDAELDRMEAEANLQALEAPAPAPAPEPAAMRRRKTVAR